jgi:hypothetical protein
MVLNMGIGEYLLQLMYFFTDIRETDERRVIKSYEPGFNYHNVAL